MIKDFKSLETLPYFEPLFRVVSRMSPNQVSVFGFLASILCAVLALNHYFGWAALAVAAHLFCDGLDGYIARKFNKTSQMGFLLDHIFDRLSDLFLFPAIGYALNILWPAVLVSIVCLFSSYIGILFKTIGAKQDKGGLFAKAYRYQGLILILIAISLWPKVQSEIYTYFCFFSLLVGIITIIHRTKNLFLTVRNQGPKL
jgi:phosphatidylglycerophosphate synthase